VINKKHDKAFTSKRTVYIQRMVKEFLAFNKIFRREKKLKNKFFTEKSRVEVYKKIICVEKYIFF